MLNVNIACAPCHPLKKGHKIATKSPRSRHEIATSLHGRFGITTKIATKITCVNRPFIATGNVDAAMAKMNYGDCPEPIKHSIDKVN